MSSRYQGRNCAVGLEEEMHGFKAIVEKIVGTTRDRHKGINEDGGWHVSTKINITLCTSPRKNKGFRLRVSAYTDGQGTFGHVHLSVLLLTHSLTIAHGMYGAARRQDAMHPGTKIPEKIVMRNLPYSIKVSTESALGTCVAQDRAVTE
jgi:hypothetical protein